MRLTLNDLIVAIDGDNPSRLLSSWRWLVNETFTPLLATAIGDMFLIDGNGSVHWLDVCCGTLSEVATSVSEFKQ
ncbi:MAG: hypothetical protein JWM11_5835 [Planctomycetaceae bacterium]|nr:hypothetical protein [Planctomycetaceae bacterium]